MLSLGGISFALPQINIIELLSVADSDNYSIDTINDKPVLKLREKLLPLVHVNEVLGLNPTGKEQEEEACVIICNAGSQEFGLIVDRIFDTEEIVVKPVSKRLEHLDIYSGNTILGDGRVIMILDPVGIGKGMKLQREEAKTPENGKELLSHKDDNHVAFLVFKTENEIPKAVPLEVVSRLEEIEPEDIETTGSGYVVQRNGRLIHLAALQQPVAQLVSSGQPIKAIIFEYDNVVIGLIIEEIIDVYHAAYQVEHHSEQDWCLGHLVLKNKVTELIDVSQIIMHYVPKPKMAPSAQRLKLLFIEDSPVFRKLTVPVLIDAGFEVSEAGEGKEALELVQQEQSVFDLIVSDIEMPVMDGFECIKKLRTMEAYRDIPVVFFSSTLDEGRIKQAQTLAAVGCVHKNDRPQLLRVLQECVEKLNQNALMLEG